MELVLWEKELVTLCLVHPKELAILPKLLAIPQARTLPKPLASSKIVKTRLGCEQQDSS